MKLAHLSVVLLALPLFHAQAQDSTTFVDCVAFVSSNDRGTQYYGGGDVSHLFDKRWLAVEACKWVQQASCVRGQLTPNNSYVFENRIQAAQNCQLGHQYRGGYGAVLDDACYTYLSDRVYDNALLARSRSHCVRYVPGAAPAPAPSPRPQDPTPVGHGYAFTFEECYNWPDPVTEQYESCVNRNFQHISFHANISMSSCRNEGDRYDVNFGACIRRNFAAAEYGLKLNLRECRNDTSGINPSFTSCVRENFAAIKAGR